MRTPAIPTSRSRNVTAGIFLSPTVNRTDVDPLGIYCAPPNYSRIGKHLDLEFVDRYAARHSFVIVSPSVLREIALRYWQKCTNTMLPRDNRDHKPKHIKRIPAKDTFRVINALVLGVSPVTRVHEQQPLQTVTALRERRNLKIYIYTVNIYLLGT